MKPIMVYVGVPSPGICQTIPQYTSDSLLARPDLIQLFSICLLFSAPKPSPAIILRKIDSTESSIIPPPRTLEAKKTRSMKIEINSQTSKRKTSKRKKKEKELSKVVDWSLVDKEDYLLAMERSPIRDIEIKYILKNALTDKINDREVFMKGIDHSYYYEDYTTFKIDEL